MRFERMSIAYGGAPAAAGARVVEIVWEGLLARIQVPARWRPPVDIYEVEGALHVVVEIAGVDADDLELRLYDDALTIGGERRWSAPPALQRVDAAEIRYGVFSATVPLPADVDHARVASRYDRGLLQVVLPRRRSER
jgi:HSP20 family protein